MSVATTRQRRPRQAVHIGDFSCTDARTYAQHQHRNGSQSHFFTHPFFAQGNLEGAEPVLEKLNFRPRRVADAGWSFRFVACKQELIGQ